MIVLSRNRRLERREKQAKRRTTLRRFYARVERLEPRAMLSASMGSMPGGYDAAGFNGGDQGPHFEGPAMFDGGAIRDANFGGPTHGQSDARAIDSRGDVRDAYGVFDPYGGPYGGFVSQYQFAPPPPTRMIIILVPTKQFASGASQASTPTSNSQQSNTKGNGSSGFAGLGGFALAPPVLPILPRYNAVEAINSIANSLSSSSSSVAIASASATAQSASVLSLNALETAFQNYVASKTLVTMGSTRWIAEALDSVENDTTTSDVGSDFVRPGAATSLEAPWLWADDALTRERKATDEVLTHLHDFDTIRDEWRAGTLDMDASGNTAEAGDAADQLTIEDQLAHAEASGMILIQATGDANASKYDASDLFELAIKAASAQRGVEASVGLHQAFDVSVDDGLFVQPVESPVDAATTPTTKSHDRPAKEAASETSFMGGATAAVGATALYGVLIKKKSDDEKRRSRGDGRR